MAIFALICTSMEDGAHRMGGGDSTSTQHMNQKESTSRWKVEIKCGKSLLSVCLKVPFWSALALSSHICKVHSVQMNKTKSCLYSSPHVMRVKWGHLPGPCIASPLPGPTTLHALEGVCSRHAVSLRKLELCTIRILSYMGSVHAQNRLPAAYHCPPVWMLWRGEAQSVHPQSSLVVWGLNRSKQSNF